MLSSAICLYWPGQREHTYIAQPRLRQRLSHFAQVSQSFTAPDRETRPFLLAREYEPYVALAILQKY